MGCDGGTIPRRDELVRTKKKPEKKDKNAETVAKWKHCAISQDPLHKPIVACELGRLYNKESVLEHLLNKDKANVSEVYGHIGKLSDVKELNLTEKNGFKPKGDQKGDEYVDFNDSRFICPVTGLDMNGTQRFCFLWKCGCVLSERAVKEVKSETCHKCGKSFGQNDIIILNGTEEEVDVLKERMTERRRLAKLEKKKKKAESAEGSISKRIKTEPEEPVASTSGITVQGKLINGINSEETFSKINGIKTEEKEKSRYLNEKKIKETLNGESGSKIIHLPEKAQRNYSIANDPTASSAYKSLFTSHKSAKKQEKAHWITHNPLYF